jgi:RNA polymerase sigma factor (sigma-70 family)
MTPKRRIELNLKETLPPLIESIKNGDSSAREELAVLLLPYIKLLVRKYEKVIDDDIESLSGWITTRIITKIDSIDTKKSIVGYIAKCAINYCIDLCRKYNRSLRKTTKNFDQLTYEEFYNNLQSSTIEEGLVESFITENFTSTDAQIVSLYYVQNKTLSEISIVTGQPEEIIQETVTLAREYICQ